MPLRTRYEKVGKAFLSKVFDTFRSMRNQLQQDSNLTEDEKIVIDSFDKYFNIHKKPKDFFYQFYRTRLMKSNTMHIEYPFPRKAVFVSIFGYLRTLLLGVIKGSAHIGFLSNRVEKYKETFKVVSVFEDFIKLYRAKIGFTPTQVPKYILASANVYSSCKKKPMNLCLPPQCEYIRDTRRAKGFCRKSTRKVRHHKSKNQIRSHHYHDTTTSSGER